MPHYQSDNQFYSFFSPGLLWIIFNFCFFALGLPLLQCKTNVIIGILEFGANCWSQTRPFQINCLDQKGFERILKPLKQGPSFEIGRHQTPHKKLSEASAVFSTVCIVTLYFFDSTELKLCLFQLSMNPPITEGAGCVAIEAQITPRALPKADAIGWMR